MHKIQASLMDREKRKILVDKWTVRALCFIVLSFCLFIFFTKVLLFSVYIDGASMYPTLNSKDVVFVSRSTDVKVGDIVVIDGEKKNSQGGYDWLIKRVIAIGEKDKTVVVEIKNGSVYVGYKGEGTTRLKEDYLPVGTQTTPYLPNPKAPYWELKEGQIFYLGDNRENSLDSRSTYDLCEKEQIVGIVPKWALSFRWLSSWMFDAGQYFNNLFRR